MIDKIAAEIIIASKIASLEELGFKVIAAFQDVLDFRKNLNQKNYFKRDYEKEITPHIQDFIDNVNTFIERIEDLIRTIENSHDIRDFNLDIDDVLKNFQTRLNASYNEYRNLVAKSSKYTNISNPIIQSAIIKLKQYSQDKVRATLNRFKNKLKPPAVTRQL